MEQATSITKLKEFALSNHTTVDSGTVFINQANRVPDETIMADEDMAGTNVLQVLTVLVDTSKGAMIFEYPFNEATELEEIHAQLEEIYQVFTKKILDAKQMNEKIRAYNSN